MHDITAIVQRCGYDRKNVYDVNVLVLIHYSGHFRHRVELFKAFGLLNIKSRKVHITLVGSKGDGAYVSEITSGWNSVDVTFLEMSSSLPIPKINGFYLWLAHSGLNARWHLRVDDDSITDVDRLLSFAETRFGDTAIHLMASPNHGHVFGDMFERMGISVPSHMHEYEASLTSAAALNTVFSHRRAFSFLEESGRFYSAPGDIALALAMHVCKVPTAACPLMTKDFAPTGMSISGAQYCHIHYVDWNNVSFTGMLRAMISGTRKRLRPKDIDRMIDRPLEFGRVVGDVIGGITLLASGAISGCMHPSETFWYISGNALVFCCPNGVPSSIFNVVISYNDREWLIGPFLGGDISHYLTHQCCDCGNRGLNSINV